MPSALAVDIFVSTRAAAPSAFADALAAVMVPSFWNAARKFGMDSLARIGVGDAIVGAASKTTMQTIAAQGAATRKFFFGEDAAFKRLGDIKRPVLVANGDQDRAFAVENSVALVRAIPGSKLAIYPDSGHAFLFQHAERFAQDVTSFLTKQ